MVILVDTSNLLYRVAYSLGPVLDFEGVLFGIFRSLYNISKTYPGSELVLVKDNYPKARMEKTPSYKGGRIMKGPDIKEVVRDVNLAEFLPVASLAEAKDHEADDVIATLAGISDKTLIYSADDDFCQLINSRIKLLKPKNPYHPQREVGEEYVLEKYGVPPSKVVRYRAIRGDSSDNIKGIYRFPSKVAAAHVNQSESLSSFLTPSACMPDKWKVVFKDNVYKVVDNLDMMTLKRDCKVEFVERTGDVDDLLNTFRKYRMNSLIGIFPNFITFYENSRCVRSELSCLRNGGLFSE
jgi:DNA polymerase-1